MSIPNGGFKHPNTTLRVDIAKDAARTVLETFSPTDHVGVVAFSNEPRSPSGCLGSQIARATVENKKIIHEFIDSIKPKKDTYYGKAFRSAFRLLREAKQQTPEQFENSLDMILFLTDGTPSESNINSILEEIVQGQDSLNNTIKIFVYGFGQEILNSKSQSKTDLLLMIADQNNQNMSSMFGIAGGKQLQWPQLSNLLDTSKPIGPVGNLTILPDVDTEQLRNVMGTYYTKFPMSQHTDYSISLPHIEDKLGLVTTLGIPTLDKGGNFFGVMGIDLSLLLMFYEVVHFRQGQHGYGFVVGNSGKILVHPYMPNPQQQMEQPRFYEIDQIEPVLSDESVFNITNGLPGHFYSKIAALWKTPDVQGTKPATYYYKPISHFHGNYSVVLVIFDEDMEELRADEDIEKGEFPSFIYHRMDLYDNDTLSIAGFCTRDNSVVLKNNATVKFAPSVYSNPVKSLEYEQNNKNRSYPFYQHYRNARLFSKNADIHQSASNDIVLTDITDQVWTQDDMIWRYLGTENGFFKIFPGTMLSDIHYDPRDDIWYRKAAENPDKYVFIDMETPKQNSSTYVTMAKVFYQTSSGSVSGVVAADMSRRQFSTILTNMMTSCLHCYILDDAGYVFGQANSSMDLTRAHITQIAGPVSFLLLKQGFLKPEVCMDATSGVKRLTYRLDLGGRWSSIRKVGCHDYTLMAINNTNLYLLSYQPDNCFSLDVGTCNCQEKCLLCNNQMDSMCQCPCTCVNRAIDICNSSFTMTRGYAPCRESLRHWKTVKTINLHQSNITECQPQCPSFQTEKDCLFMSGCIWCSTGFYSHIPICTQTCPKDRMEIYMKAPCHNLTEHSHQYLPLEVQKLLQSIVNDSNFGISLPMIIKQDMINFTISTRDRTSISNSWTKMLSKPFYTKDNIVFVNQHTMNEFTLLKLTLAFNNVNFTKEFETELTMREYIDVQVKEFISQALNDGSVTVSNVWPEQNEISCMLNTSTTNKTVLMQQTQTWNISTLPRIDVFGRPLSLVNISVEHSYNTLCHVNCHQIDDQYECNLVPGCHWDFYSQGICTNNSLIPERVKATVTLPCLGLYSNKTFSEHDVIKQFKDLLVNEIPSLEKTMLKLRMIEDSTLIGRQIQIVLQGRVTSPSVSEIWWDIQQLIEDRQNVSVNGTRYQIVGHPVAYQQFTNMYIALTLDRFNADSLIQDHPLDGREEITHAVIEVAKSYLRHQIVKSIRDIKFSMDEVTFSVDSSYDNSIDLRSEYDILQKAVTNGQVNVTIFDQTYDVKYVFFIGSFDYICPRSCDEGTQSTCSIIPGCDWSNTGKCLSDVVFPERKIINVVFPCIDIRKLTDPERNQLLSKTTQHIAKYLKTKTLSTVVTSVHYQKDNPNHIFIDLQATSRSPPLSDLYKDSEQWLKNKKLEISLNNYTLLGRSTNDFTSISVALEFSNINFTELSIYKRMDWMKELSRRLQLILSDGVSIDNEWFTLNYSIFDIKSSNNLSHHIDLDKDLEKIQTFINLGGLTFHSPSNPVTPHNVLMNGNIDCSICNLTTQICKMERKCFWQGKWDVKFCKAVNNPDKFTYEVLLPCNQTQTLTLNEKKESEIVLYNKVLQLLHPAGQHIINSVHIQQESVTIELQTSPLYPYLERYAEMLQQQVDFRTGFNFGPSNKTTDLVPRHMEDFTK
ncbi:uncharacterized protein LOC143041995 isoform X3 [Mytilus galloprovincialis]|uniref:uncharacterized protein LOC143041995 isoform X3 n=1 Tax=Mytilus galloprovincialis TaxID=29158 RepID=UPI003F7CC3F6